MGTKQAVVETWRNLIAVGADPIAITDNMNFGNPERPEIMGQFVGSVQGMKEACEALEVPGRVGQRLALQRDQRRGHPADARDRRRRPDARRRAHGAAWRCKPEGDLLVPIGREQGHLGQSLYQLIVTGKLEGAPPPVDLADEIKAGNLVRALIREGKVARRARRQRRRPAGGDRRDGAGRRPSASSCSPTRASCRRTPPGSARTRAATCWRPRPELAEEIVERARLLALPARVVGRVGGDGWRSRARAA